MMSMVNDILPSKQGIKDQLEGDYAIIEEERRLFYVGVTRTKSYIDIIVPRSINGFNTSQSKFVSEIIKIKNNKAKNLFNIFPININKTIELGSNINVGDRLYHNKFHEGEIVAINKESDTFTIEFSGVVQKQFKSQSLVGGFFQRMSI